MGIAKIEFDIMDLDHNGVIVIDEMIRYFLSSKDVKEEDIVTMFNKKTFTEESVKTDQNDNQEDIKDNVKNNDED